MLLLLHSAFMLSVVKMLLKQNVRGRALNSHGNYIVDHGKIIELCLLITVGTLGRQQVARVSNTHSPRLSVQWIYAAH